MSALLRRYPLISALVVLTVALVAMLALEIASGAALRDKVAAGSSQHNTPVQTRLLPSIAAVNPEQEYPQTVARPLFTPTRLPAPPAATAAGPSSMQKGQFVLTGVIIANGLKTALLREARSGRVVRVEKGHEVNGITVAEIEPEKVTLTQAGDSEVVALLVHKAAPGAAPAPVPAAPATGPFAAPQPPVTAPPPPMAAPAPANGANNPAARAQPPQPATSGFGPPLRVPLPQPQPQTQSDASAAQAPLTPEELLARRRARRAQQTQ